MNYHRNVSFTSRVSILLSLLFCLSAWCDTVRVGPIEVIRRDRSSNNLVLIGRDLKIESGSTNKDVVVVLGDAEIDGVVEGKLVVVLGKVQLGPQARIERNMVMIGGELNRHPEAQFAGFDGLKVALPPALVTGLQEWVKYGILWGRPLPHKSIWAWWLFGVTLVFFLFIGILMPGPVQACSNSLKHKPLSCFLAGLLGLLLFGPLIVVLAASVVGSLAIPFLICGVLAATILGQAGVNAFVGHRICGSSKWFWFRSSGIELGLGTVLIGLVYFIPVFGMVAWGLLAVLGLGAALLSFARSFRQETDEGNAVEIPPVKITRISDQSGVAELPSDSILLPRAGFWIRLGASLLDLILIGTLLKLLAGYHPQRFFLLAWFLYHFLMWGWLGTTIGGLVLGLKIFKQTGEPINFGVALVRCLASFFSALVLFIGFFWVGWNREKLAWHDIIAGTIIAKCPRGTMVN